MTNFFHQNKKIIIAATLLFLFLWLYSLLIEIKTKIQISQWKKEKQITREKIKKEWSKLYSYPTKTEKKDNHSSEEIIKAKGNINFNIVLVKPTTLPNEITTPFLEKLFSDEKYYSLNYVKEFYQREAEKYGVNNLNLKINHFGPFEIDSLPYTGDIFNPWYKDPFSTLKIKDAFDKIIKENSLSSNSKNDFCLFVYFDPSFEKEEKVEDYSFYDYKKFRSFADFYNKKAYINVYDFSPLFTKKLITIIIHESLHLFGASDKYYEDPKDEKLCNEKGRGVINNFVYLPQDKTDIMCLYVEYEEGKFRKADLEKEELIINQETAKEIGWLSY